MLQNLPSSREFATIVLPLACAAASESITYPRRYRVLQNRFASVFHDRRSASGVRETLPPFRPHFLTYVTTAAGGLQPRLQGGIRCEQVLPYALFNCHNQPITLQLRVPEE